MADEKAVISNTKTPEFEPPQGRTLSTNNGLTIATIIAMIMTMIVHMINPYNNICSFTD